MHFFSDSVYKSYSKRRQQNQEPSMPPAPAQTAGALPGCIKTYLIKLSVGLRSNVHLSLHTRNFHSLWNWILTQTCQSKSPLSKLFKGASLNNMRLQHCCLIMEAFWLRSIKMSAAFKWWALETATLETFLAVGSLLVLALM